MPYLDKLRFSRIVLSDYIDKAPDFDKEMLEVVLEVVEEQIHHIEWYNKITGGKA
jgi:ABC-type uncharacterized transport system substrate-binding protein